MAKITFLTKDNQESCVEDIKEGAKLLAVAIRSKQDIRFGCSSGKCGTCAIKVKSGDFSPMKKQEEDLLNKMKIFDGDEVRLSCMARVTESDSCVDLKFQDLYDPAAFAFDD